MRVKSWWRWPVFVLLGAVSVLACNLFDSGAAITPPPATSTANAEAANTVPTITILWPPSGSEFVIGEEITVRVSASDAIGVTRITLHSSNNVLSSRPSATADQIFDAILSWTPTRSAQYDLEVVAYRGRAASLPAPLTLFVHDRASEITNPPPPFNEGGQPAPAQPDAVCQVRVDINNLRLRSGPGTTYDILGLLDLGETLYVVGRNAASTWWQINRAGQIAWTSADHQYSTPLSDCASAPITQ